MRFVDVGPAFPPDLRRHPTAAAARRDPTGPRPVGRPRHKPDSLFADRGYDHDIYRDQVRARGIVPAIARRGTRHGTGLGTYRWVVERSFAWLQGFRRLRSTTQRDQSSREAELCSASRTSYTR